MMLPLNVSQIPTIHSSGSLILTILQQAALTVLSGDTDFMTWKKDCKLIVALKRHQSQPQGSSRIFPFFCLLQLNFYRFIFHILIGKSKAERSY